MHQRGRRRVRRSWRGSASTSRIVLARRRRSSSSAWCCSSRRDSTRSGPAGQLVAGRELWSRKGRLQGVRRRGRASCATRCEPRRSCGVLGHVERFVSGYADQRRREGNADFEDLLIWSRDLVRDNLMVREHFRRRTTHILVDEFQDTDPIQAELIAWICAPPRARPATGATSRPSRAACSSSATRSSRSTASAAPTSPPTTR